MRILRRQRLRPLHGFAGLVSPAEVEIDVEELQPWGRVFRRCCRPVAERVDLTIQVAGLFEQLSFHGQKGPSGRSMEPGGPAGAKDRGEISPVQRAARFSQASILF